MRKSYNGLSALVKNQLRDNPLNGELFVFVNRRQNQMKILYFDRSGFCIWSKKLEQGQFVVRAIPEGKIQLKWTQLKLLLGVLTASLRDFFDLHIKQPRRGYPTPIAMSAGVQRWGRSLWWERHQPPAQAAMASTSSAARAC